MIVNPPVFSQAGVFVNVNKIRFCLNKTATVLQFSDLITAIINFLLIALTLFCIIRVINRVRQETDDLKKKFVNKDEE